LRKKKNAMLMRNLLLPAYELCKIDATARNIEIA
jgi:hypothetical protein